MDETTKQQKIEESIRIYTEKYAKEYGYSIEEAKTHITVKNAAEYYRENPPKDDAPLPRTELDIGCKGGC